MTCPFTFPFGKPQTAAASYSVARSLRFNSADSAYLSRTPGGAGSLTTWTFSAWVKRAALGVAQTIISADRSSAAEGAAIYFTSSDTLQVYAWNGSAFVYNYITTQVFRDPSAWFHLVVTLDTSNGTSADRVRIYVDGVRVTAFGTSTAPSSGASGYVNAAQAHSIGRNQYNTSQYANLYLAEIHHVDGTALDATSFGQTDSTTGQWVPKQVTGVTYGTNGFWLSFYDNTSTTTLGRDDAGGAAGSAAGSNDWTLNNFSVTAGSGNDSLTDTPTNNYCVMNAIYKNNVTLANGGLDTTSGSNATGNNAFGTLFPTSGAWYFEYSPSATYTYSYLGVGLWGELPLSSSFPGSTANVVGVEVGSGIVYRNNTSQGTYTGLSAGDIGMVAWDCATGKVWMGRNGTWFNSGNPAAGTGQVATIPTLGAIGPMLCHYTSSGTITFNFGQRAFAHTPPTGFVALCTSNLSTPSIVKPNAQFNALLYTGNGSARSITGLGHQPDLVWIKARSAASHHAIYDSVRGARKTLVSSSSSDEASESSGVSLTSFDSDGFSLGTDNAIIGSVNANTTTFAAWCWKEGITPGLDIVTYTGAGAGTVAHNLGVAPKFIIVKARTTAGTDQTAKVYHASLANTEALDLGSTSAKATGSSLWNSTTPTSSVFSVGSTNGTSGDTYVAYAFAEVADFSKFGSYTGNGSADGPFVHCGFRPRWILIKSSTVAGSDWYIYDTARDSYNVASTELYPNSSSVEASGSRLLDILSNGFKIRTTNGNVNTSSGGFVFAAFAEFPFKYANAR